MNIQLNISLIQVDSSSSNKVTSTIHAPTKFVVFRLTHMFRISACDKGFEWNDVTRKCLVVTDISLVVIFGMLFGEWMMNKVKIKILTKAFSLLLIIMGIFLLFSTF